MARCARTLGVAMLLLGSVAAGAGAATLKIVVPRRVHVRQTYAITVTGRFNGREVRKAAYLIAAIQFGAKPCQPTAMLENNLPNPPQFYFLGRKAASGAGIWERTSPFSRTDAFNPRSRGQRHVCAYLYPKFVGPTDNTAPIATADAAYRVLRHR